MLNLSPRDAAVRSIGDGDSIKVYNDRGAFVASARVNDGLMNGVAQVPTGAWFDPEEPGAAAFTGKAWQPQRRDAG